MKTKKFVKSVVIFLLVVVILISLVVHFAGDAALKTAIETAATKALGVNVSVGKISFSILAGKVEIKDLVIDNPEGYAHPEMLNISHGYIDVSIASLLSDTVEIKSIKFDGIDMVLEQKGLSNNLKEVINNLPSSDAPAKAPSADEPAKEAKSLLISNLEISNVTVKAKLLPIPGKADTITLKVAPIQMTNLGSDDKLSTSKLAGKILEAIARGIAQQGIDLLPKDMVGDINAALKDNGAQVFDKSKKALEIGEKVIEGGKELGDALKGLFK